MYVSSGAGVRSLAGGQLHVMQSLLCTTAEPKREENQERLQDRRSRRCPQRRRQRRGRHNHRQTGWCVLLRFSICCIWADFGGMFIVRCSLCLRQRLIGRRRDQSCCRSGAWWGCADTLHGVQNPKCWIAFAQLGRLSLDSTLWSTGSERSTRRYIHAFPTFFFSISSYYITHPSIHHIIFRFPHLPPVSLG